MLYILLLLLLSYLCDYVVLSDRAAFYFPLWQPRHPITISGADGGVCNENNNYGTPTPPPNVYNNNMRHITRRRSEESARAFLGHNIINWLLEVFFRPTYQNTPDQCLCVRAPRSRNDSIILLCMGARVVYILFILYGKILYYYTKNTMWSEPRSRGGAVAVVPEYNIIVITCAHPKHAADWLPLAKSGCRGGGGRSRFLGSSLLCGRGPTSRRLPRILYLFRKI